MVRSLRLVLALALAGGVAGCETLEKLNPFDQKKPPLPGERRPVFPDGVPGVTYSAPPAQPGNSNISINPADAGTEGSVTAPVGRN